MYKIRFYVIECWSWGKDMGSFSLALFTGFAFSCWLLFLPVPAPLVASSRSNLGSIASAACPGTRINSASSEIRTTYEANWQHPFCPSARRWTGGIADGLWMYGILTLATRPRSCTCILKPCRNDERLSYPVCSIKRYVDRPETAVYLGSALSPQQLHCCCRFALESSRWRQKRPQVNSVVQLQNKWLDPWLVQFTSLSWLKIIQQLRNGTLARSFGMGQLQVTVHSVSALQLQSVH